MNKNQIILVAFFLFACSGKENASPVPDIKTPPTDGSNSITEKVQGITLSANGSADTYALINSVLGGTGDIIEAPDISHPNFGKHITQVYDKDLDKHVFAFHIHVTPDNDRGTDSDRQRNEIKTYDKSPDSLKATLNETVKYSWKFKVDENFKPSSNFTHLHQIKPVDGNASLPIITLTARYKSSGDLLELIHTGDDGVAITKTSIPLVDLKGNWVEVEEQIKYATKGSYQILIKRLKDNKVLLNKAYTGLDLWRTGTSICRPKWGIYRSLLNPQMLRDETVLFNDFNITEIK